MKKPPKNNPPLSPLWHSMHALRIGQAEYFYVRDTRTAVKAYPYAKSWGFRILTKEITPEWMAEMAPWQRREIAKKGNIIVMRDETFDVAR